MLIHTPSDLASFPDAAPIISLYDRFAASSGFAPFSSGLVMVAESFVASQTIMAASEITALPSGVPVDAAKLAEVTAEAQKVVSAYIATQTHLGEEVTEELWGELNGLEAVLVEAAEGAAGLFRNATAGPWNATQPQNGTVVTEPKPAEQDSRGAGVRGVAQVATVVIAAGIAVVAVAL